MSKKRLSRKLHKTITAALACCLVIFTAITVFSYIRLTKLNADISNVVQQIAIEKTMANRAPELEETYSEYDRKTAQLEDMNSAVYDYTDKVDKLQAEIDDYNEQIQYETECKESFTARYKIKTYEELFEAYQKLRED